MSNQDFQYKVGLGNVGSYQVSGKPWVTASIILPALGGQPLTASFPNVTKFIVVKNPHVETTCRVGFSLLGVTGSNYFTLAPSESFSADLRVAKIWFISDSSAATGSISVVAGLTGIDAGYLVGNWTGSAGVG